MARKLSIGDAVRVHRIPELDHLDQYLPTWGMIVHGPRSDMYPQLRVIDTGDTPAVLLEGNYAGTWDIFERNVRVVPPEEWPDEVCAAVALHRMGVE